MSSTRFTNDDSSTALVLFRDDRVRASGFAVIFFAIDCRFVSSPLLLGPLPPAFAVADVCRSEVVAALVTAALVGITSGAVTIVVTEGLGKAVASRGEAHFFVGNLSAAAAAAF
jgi:hypothetical protein